MKADQGILVILAAANHDPTANSQPERFDIFRKDRQIFAFGRGVHTCPGQTLAAQIAQAGVMQCINAGVDFSPLLDMISYQRLGERPPSALPELLKEGSMIAVIFEVLPKAIGKQAYLDIAANLHPFLNDMDGFISIERFESLSEPGKILSIVLA